MKKHSILIGFWLVLMCVGGYAQIVNSGKAADEAAVRGVIDNFREAWTSGDARKFGDLFAPDADFIVWTGTYVNGREKISEGHQRIFDTIYKDTKMQMNIRKIRFLSDSVAVVHTQASVVKKTEDFPKEPQVVPVFVMSKENGKWQIVAFQNTRVDRAMAAAK